MFINKCRLCGETFNYLSEEDFCLNCNRKINFYGIKNNLIIEKETNFDKKLAKKLHELFCTKDHNERCDFGFEQGWGGDEWSYPEHQRWLEKAKRIITIGQKHNIDERELRKFIKIYQLLSNTINS